MEPVIAALGVRYRTQHPFWGIRCFADFALLDHKLVMEVDDASHKTAAKRRSDLERTGKLNRLGYTVARCTNDEALSDPRAALSRMLSETKLQHLMKD